MHSGAFQQPTIREVLQSQEQTEQARGFKNHRI